MGKKKENNFEKSLSRLQEISDLLANSEIGLDESIKLYEEGVELAKSCYDSLKNAELVVTDLKKQLEESIKK